MCSFPSQASHTPNECWDSFIPTGGICCSLTHGALTPVDVVKTRMQLDPVTYNRGMIAGFGQVRSSLGDAKSSLGDAKSLRG